MMIRASRGFKVVGLMTLCAVAQISSAGLSDFSLTSDPFFSGHYFQVSDSEYMQDLGLDIPGDHFAVRPFVDLDVPSSPVFSPTPNNLSIENLSDYMTYSYENYDGEWYTYDHEVDGHFSDWVTALHKDNLVRSVLWSFSSDFRLSIVLPTPAQGVPSVPAQGGIALLALAGIGATRRRR